MRSTSSGNGVFTANSSVRYSRSTLTSRNWYGFFAISCALAKCPLCTAGPGTAATLTCRVQHRHETYCPHGDLTHREWLRFPHKDCMHVGKKGNTPPWRHQVPPRAWARRGHCARAWPRAPAAAAPCRPWAASGTRSARHGRAKHQLRTQDDSQMQQTKDTKARLPFPCTKAPLPLRIG